MRTSSVALISLLLLVPAPLLAGSLNTDAVLGGALGGGVGALIGSEVGGRNGAYWVPRSGVPREPPLQPAATIDPDARWFMWTEDVTTVTTTDTGIMKTINQVSLF
jgi:hypothetical protein